MIKRALQKRAPAKYSLDQKQKVAVFHGPLVLAQLHNVLLNLAVSREPKLASTLIDLWKEYRQKDFQSVTIKAFHWNT